MSNNDPIPGQGDPQEGAVMAIFLRPAAGKPTRRVEQVRAVSGRGLEGDYFFKRSEVGEGDPARKSGPDREVTLIEVEALRSVAREHGLYLDLGESRRNLVTQGVSLNDLVGRQFRIGDALLQGIRLCEPCSHLAGLTQKEVIPALVHRGGLRARILAGGPIRVGDPVLVLDQQYSHQDLHENLEEELDG